MQVKDFLPRSGAVLLNDADAVCFYGCFDCGSDFFGDPVCLGKQFLGGVEYVFVVRFGYDEGVAFAYGSDIHESQNLLVFVDDA